MTWLESLQWNDSTQVERLSDSLQHCRHEAACLEVNVAKSEAAILNTAAGWKQKPFLPKTLHKNSPETILLFTSWHFLGWKASSKNIRIQQVAKTVRKIYQKGPIQTFNLQYEPCSCYSTAWMLMPGYLSSMIGRRWLAGWEVDWLPISNPPQHQNLIIERLMF